MLNNVVFFAGDFNCKSPWWGYAGTDHVGRTVQAFVEANDVAFLNDKDAKYVKQCFGSIFIESGSSEVPDPSYFLTRSKQKLKLLYDFKIFPSK